MKHLPWLLLASTLTVRVLIAFHYPLAFWVDLASVPAWLFYYYSRKDKPLMAVPLTFAALDVKALVSW